MPLDFPPSFFSLLYFWLFVGAMASCWVGNKKATSLLAYAAVGMGFFLSAIQVEGLIALVLMGALIFMYNKIKTGILLKALLFLCVTCGGLLFYKHMIPGFQNLIWAQHIHVSIDSTPYRFYVNADKVSVALMFLMGGIALNKDLKGWVKTIRVLPVPFMGVALVLLGTAFAAHYIRWDPKLPAILGWWIPANLFFVCVTEEVLFRGVIQHQLSRFLKGLPAGQGIAVGISAIIFGLDHYEGGPIYVILATLAGMGYGYVYLRSQRIESPILLHFLANLTHILLFSYPALMRG